MSVTVLIPIRNGFRYLTALRNNLSSNLRELDEILVIDDGSDDGTPHFVEDWAIADSRVKLIKNPNPGLANALNLGILNAKYSFIARLDVDDLITLERIEMQENFLSSEDVCAVFSDGWIMGEMNVVKGRIYSPILKPFIMLSLASNRRLPHSSVMFKKNCIIQVGGYSQQMYPIEDLDLWIKVSEKYNVGSIDNPLIFYMRGGESVTSLNRTLMIEKRKKRIGTSEIIYDNYRYVLNDWFSLRKLIKLQENYRIRLIYSLIDLIETSKHFPKLFRENRSLYFIIIFEIFNFYNIKAFYGVLRNIKSVRSD